ncbi:MAG: hypothetical protein PHQ28_03010 [Mycobacterium sp.]|nr:hypothetical protein [Mycobacterium sp.]
MTEPATTMGAVTQAMRALSWPMTETATTMARAAGARFTALPASATFPAPVSETATTMARTAPARPTPLSAGAAFPTRNPTCEFRAGYGADLGGGCAAQRCNKLLGLLFDSLDLLIDVDSEELEHRTGCLEVGDDLFGTCHDVGLFYRRRVDDSRDRSDTCAGGGELGCR